MSHKETVFKPLYRRAANGGYTKFECSVKGNEVHRFNTKLPVGYDEEKKVIVTTEGPIVPKKLPKRQEMAIMYGKVTNKGKTCEGTPEQNALTLANAERKKKKDIGFTEDKPIVEKKEKGKKKDNINARALNKINQPMLLQRYDKVGLPKDEDVTISIKWDGLHGLYKMEEEKIVSRKGLVYHHLDHLYKPLRILGELSEKYLTKKGYEPREDGNIIIECVDFEIDVEKDVCKLLQDKVSIIKSAEKSIPHKDISKVIARVFNLADRAIVQFKDRYAALVYSFKKIKKNIGTNKEILNKKQYKSIQLVVCIDTCDDASFCSSLKDNNIDVSFSEFLVNYEPNPQPRDPSTPLSKAQVDKWLDGKLDIKVEDRIRLVHRWITDYLEEEGSVIRLSDGLYEGNDYHSKRVLKYKDFEDEEAVIVDAEECKGNKKGALKFCLRSLVNKQYYACSFAEEMGISVKIAREMWTEWCKDESKYYGRVVKVRMQDRYDSGVPQMGGIVCFRDGKDCPYSQKQIDEILAYDKEHPRPKKGQKKKDDDSS